MKPTLAIIDIEVSAGADELAREGLLENLARHSNGGRHVVPLWINFLRERADLRVVCLVHDLERFDDYMVDAIRAIPGVRGTSAQLAFDGMAYAEALLDVSMLNGMWDRRAGAAVYIKTQPGQDREAYQALLDLPTHDEVAVVWLVKLFHSQDADLLMLLLGARSAALTGYVGSWVRTIPGIVDTQLSTVQDWRVLGRTEDFIHLAQRFPDTRPVSP